MNLTDILEELHVATQKKSAAEFSSPCPYCQSGTDRFTIWPDKCNVDGSYKGGRFWCRVCNKQGDAINLLRDFCGLSFSEACQRLKINPGERNAPKPKKTPQVAKNPPDAWSEKAAAFVAWCHDNLLHHEPSLSALQERGLTFETIKDFQLGYNPKTLFRDYPAWGLPEELKPDGKPRRIWLPAGFVIPTFEGDKLVKLKIRNADYEKALDRYEVAKIKGNPPKYAPSKYVVVSGSKKTPSLYGNAKLDTLLILESELDAILMVQEAGDICSCLALGGSTQPLDAEKEELVGRARNLLFCPDFDKAGKVSWDRWKERFPGTSRLLTPKGKDPAEAWKMGVDLRDWMSGAINK